MGSVWRAEHLGWEAPVAIKLMNRDVAEQPEARARFEREVRLAAELRSPHVVQVLDHGVDESSRIPFITMELLEGESLDGRLRRQGRLSPAETLEIISQVVRALSRAHDAGVVHRDLKPENLFLVRNEEQSLVKVLDFGIAKGSRTDLAARLTRPGRVLGTPFYMSPEQFRGAPEIDHRADLWSLSAITCECLTGRRPFEAKDIGELALLLLRNSGRPLPSALGPVPAGFDAWFLRATHLDVEQRFQTARELGSSLARVCGSSAARQHIAIEPTEELPVQSSQGLPGRSRLRSGARLRWTPARVAGLGALVCLPIAAGAGWQYQRQRAAARAVSAAPAPPSAPEMATLALRPPPLPVERPTPAAAPAPSSTPPSQEAPASSTPAASSRSDAPLPASSSSPGNGSSGALPRGTAAAARPATRQVPTAVRPKQRSSRAGKPARQGPATHAVPDGARAPIDVNGRPIHMTLE